MFLQIFFYTILAKYPPKRTRLHHFFLIFSGEQAPEPPKQTRGFAMQIPPLFQKYFEPPLPPK